LPSEARCSGCHSNGNFTITGALNAEDGQWLMSSFERLRHFGYRSDTY
jgi:hypothetical protein